MSSTKLPTLLSLLVLVLVATTTSAAPWHLRRTQEDDLKWFEGDIDERYDYLLPLAGPQEIVGGSPASSGEFPWFVSLEYEGQIYCGGTLISANRVLSAAHCFLSSSGSIFLPTQIRVGHTTTSDGETVTPSCVSIHPDFGYDLKGVYSDLAVLSLSSPVTTVTSFVVLNSDTSHPSSGDLTAIGFGRTSTDGPTSSSLLKTTEAFVSESTCKEAWECVSSTYHVCAVGASNNGVCKGDSGGPLLDSAKVQVGVASFVGSDGCGTSTPEVFASVASFHTWIQGELTSGTCTSSHTLNTATPCSCVCLIQRAFIDATSFFGSYFD
ncbi:Trypsin delta/gamma-like protein CG30031 [Seminavis robusta]|uniref:Trypsin delta/gamma-like protein CG30031 n=1 Tax=Seminavis robusta TaxID=568900 RepID=A0A9N8DPB4_9STRA|nr:Trypsin delta/gamma-like protein CG30031 [Seminavis robusta]|eukprot:Sro166_g074120.1 Trypsin delta/gamma-like protein CG30031 (324) ;mRNA; f:32465-33706